MKTKSTKYRLSILHIHGRMSRIAIWKHFTNEIIIKINIDIGKANCFLRFLYCVLVFQLSLSLSFSIACSSCTSILARNSCLLFISIYVFFRTLCMHFLELVPRYRSWRKNEKKELHRPMKTCLCTTCLHCWFIPLISWVPL